MSTQTIEITVSDAIKAYAGQNLYYAEWDFADAAWSNGWTSIAMVCDPMGSPVDTSTNSRDYQYVTWRYAQAASNAEAIVKILDAADALTDGCDWSYGPGRSFVYNADNAAMVAAVAGIECALSDSGYLDDDRAGELEYEENHPSETECYADGECGCYVNTHECGEVLSLGIESGEIGPDDESWHCQYCDESYEIDDEWREKAAMWQHRRDLAAAEDAGQGRIF